MKFYHVYNTITLAEEIWDHKPYRMAQIEEWCNEDANYIEVGPGWFKNTYGIEHDLYSVKELELASFNSLDEFEQNIIVQTKINHKREVSKFKSILKELIKTHSLKFEKVPGFGYEDDKIEISLDDEVLTTVTL